MHDIQTIVIGAGVAGLAIGRALALSGREVMVLERHDLIGSETSSRNSEVIHAGIYYPSGSLKARLCVAGKHALYAYCKERGVGFSNTGKLIIASTDNQLPELHTIRAKAAKNGVDDLQLLDRDQTLSMESELDVAGALWSPSTGIVDSHGLMLALEGDLATRGGQVVLHTAVARIEALGGDGYRVHLADPGGEGGEAVTCRELVISAGHAAPFLAAQLDGMSPPTAYLAKGSYFKLEGKAPFSRLIYPVPEPGGLGIHLTLDLQNQAKFGPDVEWVETADLTVDPERGKKFYAAIRAYWPGLRDGALVPDYAGLRPKIVPEGAPAADFRIDGPAVHGHQGLVALYGIESPGLTAALAIGEHVRSLIGAAP